MDSNPGKNLQEQANLDYAGPLVVTAAVSLTAKDTNVILDSTGTFTVTLPPVAEARGRFYAISAPVTAPGTITVANIANESVTPVSMALTAAGDRVLLYSDGSEWYIVTDVTT